MTFNKILLAEAPLKIITCSKDENYPKPWEFLEKEHCLFLNPTNVTNFGFNFEKTMFITKEKDELLKKGKLKRGDVVLIIKNNIGNVAFYGEDIEFKNIRISSNMVILRTEDSLLSRFLYYFLQSDYFKKQIYIYKHGYPYPQRLPISSLKNIEFYFPTINQQKNIVNFISQFDKKIELYKKINQNLEEQLKTIFNSFFVYFDDFSKDDLKESEIGLIPKYWDLLSLGEITSQINENAKEDTYNIFSFVNNGNLILSDKIYVKNDFKNRFENYIIVKQNEFVYNPFKIDKGFIAGNNFDLIGCVKPFYVVFKVEQGYENFMKLFIKSKMFKNWVNSLFNQKLNYDDFSLIKIPHPPKDLINKFNIIYENFHEVINHNKSLIDNLKRIKEILLPKLISGELIE